MEELLSEGVLKSVLRFFKWIIIDATVEGLFFYTGYLTLLILTLGKYPRGEMVKKHEGRISLFGAFVLAILLLIIGLNN
ncbi:hypothetical protein EYS14_05395 [Alteromonadaceae bacterium M269]|nr:hypothetical protein EYS14_05395 [Alteromonadaceae bacterium M269]